MALFGSSKTSSKQTLIRPTVERTPNVAKTIQKIAQINNVNPKTLDFTILDIFTYIRMSDVSPDAEWEKIENHKLYELDDATALLHPSFEIKQTYEVEIYSLSPNIYNPFPHLRAAVGANASKCKVYISIAEGSKIESDTNVSKALRDFINKKKVRAGILINIFDEMLQDVISKLSAQIQVEGSVTFSKKETILIAEGFEPTATINDALLLHYKDNEKSVNENEQVDYSARGFVEGIKKDELLIEYIKPKEGTPGRNCRGEYLVPQTPLVAHEVNFNIDDTIRIEESDTNIEYIAKENGYISFEDNTYSIKNELDIKEISFKTTGSIKSGVTSDVNLSVNESDAYKDAIGSGMEVEVSEIEIDGNVGSNARVVALKATVGGLTHKTSYVKADVLDINVHKGKAVGKQVHITRLEHGVVEADSVVIAQALGGHIRAKEIFIGICASHVHATATKTIEIQKMQGSENIFTIDPLLTKDTKKSLNTNQEAIAELSSDIKILEKKIKALKIKTKEGKSAFIDIKKRLMHYKKNGVKMPTSFVRKYKDFMQLHDDLKELQEESAIKNDKLLLYTTKTSSFQDDIFDARIINKDRWVGYNEVRFKLVDPSMDLVHKPAVGSDEMIFALVDLGDGEFKIEAVEE